MDMNLDLDIKEFVSRLQAMKPKVKRVAEQAANDIVDELIRISSEITPLDKGILQRSHTKKISVGGGAIVAEVRFSIKEGKFNYALWIHEGAYNYGKGTLARSGTTGWSGKHYAAGRKYVERPLKGEEEAFKKHLAKEIEKALEG